MDYGESECCSTRQAFLQNGMLPVGSGTFDEAVRPLLLTAGQRRIILFSAYWYRQTRHSVSRHYAMGDCVGTATLDSRLLAAISDWRARYPDAYIILSPHWGTDFAMPTPEQKAMAKQCIAAGVDCIIGHGAHIASNYEQIDGRPVLYSLGNFVFNSNGTDFDYKNKFPYSYVCKIHLYPNRTDIRLYPILVDNLRTFWQPQPVADVKESSFSDFLRFHSIDSAMVNRDEFGLYLSLPTADTRHFPAPKQFGTPWKADELASFLGGRWVSRPPEDWNATYFTAAGLEVVEASEDAVSIMIKRYKRYNKNKCKAVIIPETVEDPPSDKPVLIVPDTEHTLWKLCAFVRPQMNGKTVAITGSVGKSTVKDMLAHVLPSFGTTKQTFGTQNHLWGIQSAIAACVTDPQYAVVEVCSHVLNGERRDTLKILAQDISIITQICLSHADDLNLQTERDIARVKASICKDMKPGGSCIINRESAEYETLVEAVEGYGVRVVSYGNDNRADVFVKHIACEGNSSVVTADLFGTELTYALPFLGDGMVLNSLAVLTCVHLLGLDAATVPQALASFDNAGRHRQEIVQVPVEGGTATIIDDSFNAQPISILEALSVLRKIPKKGRRLAVFGDVKVYSDENFADEYFTLVEPIASADIDCLYFCGKTVPVIADRFPESQVAGIFEDPDETVAQVLADLRPDDVLLVKVTSAGKQTKNIAVKMIQALRQVPMSLSPPAPEPISAK
jgi:UDP-N-acetylmuramyl pentapeptide synthase